MAALAPLLSYGRRASVGCHVKWHLPKPLSECQDVLPGDGTSFAVDKHGKLMASSFSLSDDDEVYSAFMLSAPLVRGKWCQAKLARFGDVFAGDSKHLLAFMVTNGGSFDIDVPQGNPGAFKYLAFLPWHDGGRICAVSQKSDGSFALHELRDDPWQMATSEHMVLEGMIWIQLKKVTYSPVCVMDFCDKSKCAMIAKHLRVD